MSMSPGAACMALGARRVVPFSRRSAWRSGANAGSLPRGAEARDCPVRTERNEGAVAQFLPPVDVGDRPSITGGSKNRRRLRRSSTWLRKENLSAGISAEAYPGLSETRPSCFAITVHAGGLTPGPRRRSGGGMRQEPGNRCQARRSTPVRGRCPGTPWRSYTGCQPLRMRRPCCPVRSG